MHRRWRLADHRSSRPRELLGRVSTIVWVLLAIGLALRLTVVAITLDTPLDLDPQDFSRTAQSIAQGHGYPASNRAPGGGASAFRPPGYPVLLAAVYSIHAAPAVGRLLGAFLGMLSVALIGLIAFRLWGRLTGLLATAIAAVAPPLVILSTGLISEALFVPVVLAAVAAALQARGAEHRHWWAIVTGVLVGIASLTRTNGLLLLLPFVLAFAPARPRRRLRAWTPAVLVIVATCLTVAPWTIRNAIVFHAFVPISDEIGYTLAGTYNQASRADRKLPAVWREAEHGKSPEYARILRRARAERWNELTYGNHLQSAAIDDIRSDPGYLLKVAYWNTVRMFNLGELGYAENNLSNTGIPAVLALIELIPAPMLLVLAVGGLFSKAMRQAPKWLWLVPACLFTTVLVSGFIRFRAPIDPFLVMLAALVVSDIVGNMMLWVKLMTQVEDPAVGEVTHGRAAPAERDRA